MSTDDFMRKYIEYEKNSEQSINAATVEQLFPFSNAHFKKQKLRAQPIPPSDYLIAYLKDTSTTFQEIRRSLNVTNNQMLNNIFMSKITENLDDIRSNAYVSYSPGNWKRSSCKP